MLTSRLRAFGATLMGAFCLLLILASTGGAANGDNFIIGNVGLITNSATAITRLDTTASTGLWVNDTAATSTAIRGVAAGAGASTAVSGTSSSSANLSFGVVGALSSTTPGSNAAGVFGLANSTTADGPGVWGNHRNTSGTSPGVLGDTNSNDPNAAGVYGTIDSNADYAGGVRGENFNATCCGFGVVGFHAGQGIGIGGYAPNGFGVFGWSPTNWAGYFDGAVEVVHDLHVNGTLYKAGGAFRIDNPLDPAHSYLQHSFVESPDMKNIYDGVARTNAKGYATVTLPKWFQALNRDFRYQLTVVGKAHWDAKAAVWQELKNNRFTIRTDQANTKVSWQVTGIRHDAYANAHRIQVVVPKTGADARKYAHPGLYGQPASKGVTALPAGLKYPRRPAAAPTVKTK